VINNILKGASVELLNLMVYRLTLEKVLLMEKEVFRQWQNSLTTLYIFFALALVPLIFVDMLSLPTFSGFALIIGILGAFVYKTSKASQDFKELKELIETELKEVNEEITELIEIEFSK
jgi:predicted DNA-binding transcriptional regulator